MADTFDKEYMESEAKLEQQMSRTYQQVAEKKAQLRRNVELTEEEREERFATWYEPIGKNLYDASCEHIGRWDSLRTDLERQIHEGTGERFADHLTRVSEMPTEKLDELMATAQRTGQPELEQAIAEVALTRMRTGVFDRWAERNPERAAAIRRLHTLPDTDRLVTRAQARSSVPNANFSGLEPTAEDHERAAADKAIAESQRNQKLGIPRRQVGRRISPAM